MLGLLLQRDNQQDSKHNFSKVHVNIWLDFQYLKVEGYAKLFFCENFIMFVQIFCFWSMNHRVHYVKKKIPFEKEQISLLQYAMTKINEREW